MGSDPLWQQYSDDSYYYLEVLYFYCMVDTIVNRKLNSLSYIWAQGRHLLHNTAPISFHSRSMASTFESSN